MLRLHHPIPHAGRVVVVVAVSERLASDSHILGKYGRVSVRGWNPFIRSEQYVDGDNYARDGAFEPLVLLIPAV
jgi:hypothetical protein